MKVTTPRYMAREQGDKWIVWDTKANCPQSEFEHLSRNLAELRAELVNSEHDRTLADARVFDNSADVARIVGASLGYRPGYADDEIDALEGWRKLRESEAEADRIEKLEHKVWFGDEK